MEKCETASTTANSGTATGPESGNNSNPGSNKTSARSSLNNKKRPDYLKPAMSKEDEENISSLILTAEKSKSVSDLYKIGRDFGFLNVSMRRKAYMTILGITEDDIEEVQECLAFYKPVKRNEIIINDTQRSLIGFAELANLPEDSLNALRGDLSTILHYFFDTHPQFSYYQGMNNLAELFLILYGKATAYLFMERLTIRNMEKLLTDKGFSEHLSAMMQVCLKVLEKEVPEYKKVLGVEKMVYAMQEDMQDDDDEDIRPAATNASQTQPEQSPGLKDSQSSDSEGMFEYEDQMDTYHGTPGEEVESHELGIESIPKESNQTVQVAGQNSRKTSLDDMDVSKNNQNSKQKMVLVAVPMSKEEEEEATRSRLGFIVSWVVTWFSYKVKTLDTIFRIIDFLVVSPPYMASVMAALVVRQIISAHELVPGSPDEKIFLAFFGSDLDFISWDQVINQARILDQMEDYGSFEQNQSSNPFSRLIGKIHWKFSRQTKLKNAPEEYYAQEQPKVHYLEKTQALQKQLEASNKVEDQPRQPPKPEGFFKSVTRSIGMAFSSKKKPAQSPAPGH